MNFAAEKCVFTDAGRQAENLSPSPSSRNLYKETDEKVYGNSGCESACPANSITQIGGVTINDCMCDEGFSRNVEYAMTLEDRAAGVCFELCL